MLSGSTRGSTNLKEVVMTEEIKETVEEVEVVATDEQPKLPENYKPLSTGLKFFFGVGDFGFNLMSSVETYYFMFFLTNCALLDPATAALVSTVGSVADAIFGFLWGGVMNAIKPMKWGRYRSWLLFVPWIVPILFCLAFVPLGGDNTLLTAVLIIVFYVLAHAAWDFPYVANVTMIAVTGQTPDDRNHLASTRGMWSNASKILFGYLFPIVAMVGANVVYGQNITDVGQQGFQPQMYCAFVALVFGICFAALYNVHFFLTKGYEKEYTKEELANWKNEKKSDNSQNSFGDLMRAVFQNPNALVLVLADMAKWIFNFTVGGISVYYFTYVAFDPGMNALYITAANVACVIGAWAGMPLAKLLKSTKMAVITGFVVIVVGCLAAWAFSRDMMMVVVFMAIAQGGYGLVYADIAAMYSDCVVYSEWKTGKNSAGLISGLQLIPLKIGFFARGVIIPALLGMAGFVAGMSPDPNATALMDGICNCFFIVPAALCVVSILILIFGYKLNNASLMQYQKEIDERKKAEEAA